MSLPDWFINKKKFSVKHMHKKYIHIKTYRTHPSWFKEFIFLQVIKEHGYFILKTSSPSFIYNKYIVISVLKKIDSTINYKYYICDLYSMDYISTSTFHYSKDPLNCVQICTNITGKRHWIYVQYKIFIHWKAIQIYY